jgi:hypothetical protein
VFCEGGAVESGEGKEAVAGSEEGGEDGLRRAVKSTADEERCIRAKGEFVLQEDDRLSWGESST